MVPDAAHIMNDATGGVASAPSSAHRSLVRVCPATKMMYQDEYLVGVEHEFKGGLVLSGRFIYRNMPRIVEDMAGVSRRRTTWMPRVVAKTTSSATRPQHQSVPERARKRLAVQR